MAEDSTTVHLGNERKANLENWGEEMGKNSVASSCQNVLFIQRMCFIIQGKVAKQRQNIFPASELLIIKVFF